MSHSTSKPEYVHQPEPKPAPRVAEMKLTTDEVKKAMKRKVFGALPFQGYSTEVVERCERRFTQALQQALNPDGCVKGEKIPTLEQEAAKICMEEMIRASQESS